METCEYFRPPQTRMADLLRNADAKNIPPVRNAPIPSGMASRWAGKKMALTLKEDWAFLYRRTYGYIGEI